MYILVPQRVPAICRNRAVTNSTDRDRGQSRNLVIVRNEPRNALIGGSGGLPLTFEDQKRQKKALFRYFWQLEAPGSPFSCF